MHSSIVFASDEAILKRAIETPRYETYNVQKLANYLTKPYKKDYDKLKVIAYWIATHIAYDGYKYNNEKLNQKELSYKYDILETRTGICEDFAHLFVELAKAARINNVTYVNGYVLEDQKKLQKSYNRRQMPKVGHAWNEVELNGRKFFVDTTFMAQEVIGPNRKNQRITTLNHKLDIKRRTKKYQTNNKINDFYFDFTPRSEFEKYGTIHILDKYIR